MLEKLYFFYLKYEGVFWILYFVLAVIAVVELKDLLIFIIRRTKFLIRLKKLGCEVEGCCLLWWLISPSGKTSFFVRAKSGVRYAVMLVGNHYPAMHYALTSTEHWFRARWAMIMRQAVCLGFKRMYRCMDFRFDAEMQHKDSVPVWLFNPKPFCLTDRPEENPQKAKEYTTGMVYDGIWVMDANTFLTNVLVCPEPYPIGA